MNEFDLIATHFRPLAKDYSGSLELSDDAAIIAAPPGCDLVATTDAICAGVHFIGDEDAALIAKKLLRVNLSDLAAMGAAPLAYLLSLQLPKSTTPEWVARFAAGLKEDQEQFAVHLAGGDTTSNLGPLSCSITAFGSVKTGAALKRSGAKIGDAIYVSGTLGDSALGLMSLRGAEGDAAIQSFHQSGLLRCARNDRGFLEQRYFLPEPRVGLGQKLIGIAHAAMDISDGMMQDMGHICKASGVGAVLERAMLPLSAPAAALIKNDPSLWEKIYAGGDDYELLFTAPVDVPVSNLGTPVTLIGHIVQGSDVILKDEQGTILNVPRKGFVHF